MTSYHNKAHGVSASELAGFGRQALQLSKTAGLSLQESLITTLGSEGLNPHQVRRVVEYANIDAYNQKFASMDPSGARFVSIDEGPADPLHVVQALCPSESHHGDYDLGPTKEAMMTTTQAFQPFRTVAGVMSDVTDLQTKLSSRLDIVASDAASAEFRMETHMDKLAEVLRSATLNGASHGEVFGAWAGINAPLAKVAFHKTGNPIPEATKVAGRGLNPQHPVMREFNAFVKSAQDYTSAIQTRQALEDQLVVVGTWLQKRSL